MICESLRNEVKKGINGVIVAQWLKRSPLALTTLDSRQVVHGISFHLFLFILQEMDTHLSSEVGERKWRGWGRGVAPHLSYSGKSWLSIAASSPTQP